MESSILQKIGIDPAYILIGMLVLIIALFVLLFLMMGNIKNRNKQIKRLLSGTQAGDLEDIIMKRFAEMDAVKNNSKRLTKEHKEIQSHLSSCVSKIGLVKYNAFDGMGGNLSFALALMDNDNNGVVLNSMHTREGCFNYAKEIIGGESYVALSEEEKEDLFERIEQGDLLAREHYIKGNLRLVLSIIQRFSGSSENADDLFQVGCIGLMKAIDNFNPDLMVKFSTYGVPMIVGEVKRYLRHNNDVRVSRSIRDLAYHSMQAREELQKQNGREPKLSEIAARVGQSPENVAMALESAVTPTSLYEPVYSDGEDSFALLDQLRDATGEESWISDMMFRDTVRALTPRERRIIALRYLNGKTQTQVAKEIGISQAQVSRLEKAALNHIKEQICAN